MKHAVTLYTSLNLCLFLLENFILLKTLYYYYTITPLSLTVI